MTMMATVQENGRAVQPAPSAQAPVPAAATKQNGYPAKAAPATANGPGDGASSPPSQSLYDVCVELRDKIEAFLAEKIPDSEPRLQAVQKQLRVSMDVVEEALSRYPYVCGAAS